MEMKFQNGILLSPDSYTFIPKHSHKQNTVTLTLSALGFKKVIEAIELFVSIGVFFLFFMIGLEEIDIAGLFKVMRGKIFAGSITAFMIPFLVAGIFGLAIDLNFIQHNQMIIFIQ